MVNWDSKALTAVSDEEVLYKEVQSKLYYVRYQIEGSEGEYITIATTRPETILGDTAVCVHPDDERYKHLKGRRVLVPLLNRSVPLIADEYVDPAFGTGALKITPAHDINDYQLGIKYKLDTINIFNDDGSLNESAGLLVGMDRFQAREAIIPLLEAGDHLVKVEDYVNKIGYSERTQEVIEPKLSVQWFCNMQALAAPALEVVMKEEVRFFPDKLKNTYAHWMGNVKDWCISRQLWWGHRIPAYYLPNQEVVVAATQEEAYRIALEKYPELNLRISDLIQEEDVLDTWFSSWLWPITVFDGIRRPDNEDIQYYYPTSVLITAPDIIFFWVARMIMAGMEWRGEIPFRDVYFTGMVRDKLRRKMSKSLGNSPDPIELMDTYGTDGVRMGMLLSSPAGNDLMFDESLCEQGRNFNNKIWNALRLIKGWKVDDKQAMLPHARIAVDWFDARFNQVLAEIEDDFLKYRLSDALMSMYKLIWDDFCAYFLEIIKPPYQQAIDAETYQAACANLGRLMQVLHPFMPFITEEVWHALYGEEKGDIIVSSMPQAQTYDINIIDTFTFSIEVVEQIRRLRTENNIAPKQPLELYILYHDKEDVFKEVISKLCNMSAVYETNSKREDALSFVVHKLEFFIPFSNTNINVEEETAKLQEEINYLQGFLTSVEKKLSNPSFVQNAPEKVVDVERKKQNDARQKLSLLQEKIERLK
jgi:valyl-tRNA synthetase